MTAVGRAVRREVGLFVVGGSVLEGSWSLHKVDLCVSSWREVGPFKKLRFVLLTCTRGMPFYNMRFTVVLGGCKIHCTNDS